MEKLFIEGGLMISLCLSAFLPTEDAPAVLAPSFAPSVIKSSAKPQSISKKQHAKMGRGERIIRYPTEP